MCNPPFQPFWILETGATGWWRQSRFPLEVGDNKKAIALGSCNGLDFKWGE